MQIPLPPVAEQQRLTVLLQEQLAVTDAARTAAETQLATLRTLPGALLRQLFAPALASA